jgi:hypothetical protein
MGYFSSRGVKEAEAMAHPLVDQLRFARAEFQRALEGINDEDARKRLIPMNCISWNVGHLAWQEQRYWLHYGAGLEMPYPEVDTQFRYGAPASTPPVEEMQTAWGAITRSADAWLDGLATEGLQAHVMRDGQPTEYIFGSLMLRVIYHYWYHTGENMAIRQSLGHKGLPDFVGDIDSEAPYRPER